MNLDEAQRKIDEVEKEGERAMVSAAWEYRSSEDMELIAYMKVLLDVALFSPRSCVCHVKSFDGYYGAQHSQACAAYLGALKRAGIEVGG